jgi:hypothetical protein
VGPELLDRGLRMGIVLRQAAAKDGFIAAPGNVEDKGFVSAVGSEVGLDALSEFGCVDADDIVLASVVGGGAAKDVVADFLLVDLGATFFERLFTDVEEEIAEANRAA